MKVLGMDTALGACSAAIVIDGAAKAVRHTVQARGHAETIMSQVAEVCEEAGLAIKDLDRIGITVGPGTFTGQRVGLAAARGLVLGTQVQLIGVTTGQAVAAGIKDGRPGDFLFAVFDARRGQVYSQGFDHDLCALTPPELLALSAVAPRIAGIVPPGGQALLAGSGAVLVRADLRRAGVQIGETTAPAQPDARQVARLAARVPVPDGPAPAPLYLRAPDAKLPVKRRRGH